jgi:hypothetical protein
MTNRDDRTIWTCYNRAKKKRQKRSDHSSEVFIPVEILKDRTVSVLERIVEYLKEKRELSYHEIAVLLNRDDRTVWTCYNRASKKRELIKRGGKK